MSIGLLFVTSLASCLIIAMILLLLAICLKTGMYSCKAVSMTPYGYTGLAWRYIYLYTTTCYKIKTCKQKCKDIILMQCQTWIHMMFTHSVARSSLLCNEYDFHMKNLLDPVDYKHSYITMVSTYILSTNKTTTVLSGDTGQNI